MNLTNMLLTIVMSCTGLIAVAHAQDYDLVINNGRVMDPETNFDGVRNVGIKEGKVVAITKDIIQSMRPDWWWPPAL